MGGLDLDDLEVLPDDRDGDGDNSREDPNYDPPYSTSSCVQTRRKRKRKVGQVPTTPGFRKVLDKLVELKNEIDHLSNAVVVGATTGSVSVDAGVKISNLPVETTGDITALDCWIGESDENNEALVNNLQRIGGSDYGNAASRILGKLLSPSLQISFTLTGVRTNKSAFNELKLFNVVIESIKRIPSCDDKSIEKAIGDWFRNANVRVYGRKKPNQYGNLQMMIKSTPG